MNRKGYLTVGELKEALKDIPDDTIVGMSSDEEGNSYHPLGETDMGLVTEYGEYAHPSDLEEDYYSEADKQKMKPAFWLFPGWWSVGPRW